jgi:hypothetical protein
MASVNLGISEFRTSAAMWAYAVGVHHEQLRDVVAAYAQARHDGAIRNSILKAPAGARPLLVTRSRRPAAS